MRLVNIDVDSHGAVNGWYCGCGDYKDILTRSCRSCNNTRPFKLEDTVTKTIEKRGLTNYWINNMPMDDSQKELHALFFAEEKIAYKSLEFDARRSHRETLERICFEAKARISAMDWVEREENENLHPTQREWLRNSSKNPNPNLTDAITNVKERKKRVSKSDKMLADMQSLGIANASDLIATVEKHATKSKMDNLIFNPGEKTKIVLSELCRTESHSSCPARFRVGDVSHECKCACHKPEIKLDPINFDDFLGG